jgi:putative endonuclease
LLLCHELLVYILQSEENDRFYVGRSQNPERRVEHHNSTSTGFTSRYRPWELVFTQEFSTKEEAVEAEQLIKSRKSKKMTRYVIEGKIQLADRVE